MTSQEAWDALQRRPEHMRRPDWIRSDIAYELHDGIHTFHRCECGRGFCRMGLCVECLKEMLAVAEGNG